MMHDEQLARLVGEADRHRVAWLIAPAQAPDFVDIQCVVADAFGRDAEADLVERLRSSDAWLPELALTARHSTGPRAPVDGFAALTRMTVGGRPALALAPVAVAPEWQGQGAGSALVRTGIARAADRGERLIVVLGNPRYYGRFGSRPPLQLEFTAPMQTPVQRSRRSSYRDQTRSLWGSRSTRMSSRACDARPIGGAHRRSPPAGVKRGPTRAPTRVRERAEHHQLIVGVGWIVDRRDR